MTASDIAGAGAPTKREEIDALIEGGKAAVARMRLADLWREEPQAGTAAFVASRFERLREQIPMKPCRVAILRSFVVEPVVPLARAMAFVRGIDLDVYLSDFNAYTQEVLDPGSALYAFEPDAVFLAALTRDVSPLLWEQFADLNETGVSDEIERLATSYRTIVRAFREQSSAPLVVHSLEAPLSPATGVLDAQAPLGQLAAVRAVNEAIARAAREMRDVYVLDYDALAGRRGAEVWRNQRTWETARLPIRSEELIHLAAEWLRFVHPLIGITCKVLAVDLDGTLWGGVIGEDGVDGIKVDGSEGAAYRAVQRAVLDLYRRGVLLTICSKNNEDEARAALEGHPGLLVRQHHFAAFRINWESKAENLRDLAAELNVGVDNVAFLDDNPVERKSRASAGT